MKKKRKQKPSWVKKIAKERIEKLLEMAEKCAGSKPELAKRYVTMALNISKKYNATIPAELKRKFCKKCSSFFIHGKNVTVRKERQKKLMVYICRECRYANRKGSKTKPVDRKRRA